MLLYISLFTILLSLILLFNNWKINRNSVFLSLFLIGVSIYGIIHYFIIEGKSPFWLAIFYTHFSPLLLLLGPFLLFYVRGTLNDTYTLKTVDFLHFIPATVHLIGIIPYAFQPFSKKIQIATIIINNIDAILKIPCNYLYSTAISFIIRPVLLLSYILYCLFLMWKKNSVSNFDPSIPKKQLLISFRWLVILVVSSFLFVVAFLIITLHSIHMKPSVSLINYHLLYMLSGVAYCIMSFSLLLFPNVLYGIPMASKGLKKTKSIKQLRIEQESLPIQEDPFFDLSENIKKYLNTKKPFIDPDFSISDIALALQVPQNHVSYCINEMMQTKFSTLKSDLRIAYAVELLSGSLKNSFTIEGIAQKSGFKNRASFYTAFKEKTGMTPTEFIVDKTNTD